MGSKVMPIILTMFYRKTGIIYNCRAIYKFRDSVFEMNFQLCVYIHYTVRGARIMKLQKKKKIYRPPGGLHEKCVL